MFVVTSLIPVLISYQNSQPIITLNLKHMKEVQKETKCIYCKTINAQYVKARQNSVLFLLLILNVLRVKQYNF